MRLPFLRKPKPSQASPPPTGLSAGQLADLRALQAQPGFKVWEQLIEEAAGREAAALYACTDATTAFGIACRVQVWQRCYTLLDNLFNIAEALDEFRRNGVKPKSKPDPNFHLGSSFFWR